MRKLSFLVLLIVLSSCEYPAGKWEVEDNDPFSGHFYTLTMPGVRTGQKLVFACDSDHSDIQIYLSAKPERPPPLRGVFGDFTINGSPAPRVELAWMTEDAWTVRDKDPNRSSLLRKIFGANEITLTPPRDAGLTTDIVWRLPADRTTKAMRAECLRGVK